MSGKTLGWCIITWVSLARPQGATAQSYMPPPTDNTDLLKGYHTISFDMIWPLHQSLEIGGVDVDYSGLPQVSLAFMAGAEENLGYGAHLYVSEVDFEDEAAPRESVTAFDGFVSLGIKDVRSALFLGLGYARIDYLEHPDTFHLQPGWMGDLAIDDKLILSPFIMMNIALGQLGGGGDDPATPVVEENDDNYAVAYDFGVKLNWILAGDLKLVLGVVYERQSVEIDGNPERGGGFAVTFGLNFVFKIE